MAPARKRAFFRFSPPASSPCSDTGCAPVVGASSSPPWAGAHLGSSGHHRRVSRDQHAPGALGELVRVYILARTERISNGTVLVSVVLGGSSISRRWGVLGAVAPVCTLSAWFRWSYLTLGLAAVLYAGLWAHRGHERGAASGLRPESPPSPWERPDGAGRAFPFGRAQGLRGPGDLGAGRGWRPHVDRERDGLPDRGSVRGVEASPLGAAASGFGLHRDPRAQLTGFRRVLEGPA
jgi:hypothetical protein